MQKSNIAAREHSLEKELNFPLAAGVTLLVTLQDTKL